MGETVRKLQSFVGRVPPAAHFYVREDGVVLDFSYQTVELFGLGTEYHSADLYHVADHDNETERIMLELFKEAGKGQRRLSFYERNKRTRIYVTELIRQFEVAFKEHLRYPVWATGNNLYVDL